MVKPPAEPTREEQLQSQLSQQLNLPGLQDSSAAVDPKPAPPEGKVCIYFLIKIFINYIKIFINRNVSYYVYVTFINKRSEPKGENGMFFHSYLFIDRVYVCAVI